MTHHHPDQDLRAGLERRILHGLSAEWTAARAFLDLPLQKRLRPPLFRLSDSGTRWGEWASRTREISISRKLALDHSWDSVREVLHHEMAHQLAHECLGGLDEPPHGPAFQKACQLLGANRNASEASFLPLDERLAETGDTENDRILIRVKKLLALAASSNPHEAEAAMAKAHDLIARHNLELIEGNRDRSFESIFVGRPALRHPIEASQLAALVQEFYGVAAVWVPAWVMDREKMGRVLELSGTPANLRMAGYVHDFMSRYIDDQWARFKKDHPRTGRGKSQFAVALIEGFRSKLRTTPAPPARSTGRALTRIDDPLLTRYVRDRYKRLRHTSRRLSTGNERARAHGHALGRDLVIHRPVEHSRADHGPTRLIDRK